MNRYFLLFLLLMNVPVNTTAKQIPAGTRNYLRTSHHLDLLYTSLYGRQHPFKKYIAWHQQLIAEHTKQYQLSQENPPGSKGAKDYELEAALQTIQDYAHSLLGQYQIKPQNGSSLPNQLPLSALPGSTLSTPLMVTPEPGVTPTNADNMLQQYIAAMNAMQQHHTQDMNPFSRTKILKEQLAFFGVGLAVIGVITGIGVLFFNRNANKQQKLLEKYENLRDAMWGHSSAVGALAQRGQA